MATHSHWHTGLLTFITLGLTLGVRGCGTGDDPSPPAAHIRYEADPLASITAKVLVVPAGQKTAQALGVSVPFQHAADIALPDGLRGDLIAGAGIFRNGCLQAVTATEALVAQRPLRRPRPIIRWNKAHADVALFPGCGGSQNNGHVNGLVLTVEHDLLKPDCRSQPLLVSEATPAQVPSPGTVTLAGFNLQPGAAVTINGVAAQVTWQSPTSVQVQLPGGLSLGSASLKIVNPDGTQDSRDDLLMIGS